MIREKNNHDFQRIEWADAVLSFKTFGFIKDKYRFRVSKLLRMCPSKT